jgi:hypothetical protein
VAIRINDKSHGHLPLFELPSTVTLAAPGEPEYRYELGWQFDPTHKWQQSKQETERGRFFPFFREMAKRSYHHTGRVLAHFGL